MEDHVYRIALLGDEGVGKTALLVRFLCHRFLGEYDPTIEDKYRKSINIDDVTVTLEILDTASRGQNSCKLRDQFVREGDGFIVVYSTADRSTFANLHRYRDMMKLSRDTNLPSNRTRDTRPDSCPGLNEQTHDGLSKDAISVLVIGNKSDLIGERDVTRDEGQRLAETYGWLFAEASALEYEAADACIADLVRDMMAKRSMRNHRHSVPSQPVSIAKGESKHAWKRRRHSLINLFSSRGRNTLRRGSCDASQLPISEDGHTGN
ncbi:ras-like protein 1 [Nematostella vectensis]|nr:ras-like protein 1 [Nematostella vectensis]